MSRPASHFSGGRYLRFLAAVTLAVGALAAIGYPLTRARGEGAVAAMLAALAASGLASAVAGIPLARAGGPPHASFNRSLFAMLLRLGMVAVLATVCLLTLEVSQGVFLVWLVIGYLALLAVDTVFTVRFFRGL